MCFSKFQISWFIMYIVLCNVSINWDLSYTVFLHPISDVTGSINYCHVILIRHILNKLWVIFRFLSVYWITFLLLSLCYMFDFYSSAIVLYYVYCNILTYLLTLIIQCFTIIAQIMHVNITQWQYSWQSVLHYKQWQ